MKKWLFNPFIYVAGARSLVIGWVFMLTTAIVGFYSHTHFDGALDMHEGHITPLHVYLLEQLIDWASVVLMFYLGGLLFSRSSIRFIDVAGTIALARWVMIFAAIIGFGINAPDVMPKTVEELKSFITPSFILFSLISLVFAIWMVVLMYNAFTTSCNMKGGTALAVFIAGLIIAEIISKSIFYLLYKHFI